MIDFERPILPGQLRRFVADLFGAAGLCRADAQVVADTIVLQEMRGVTTHGLRRIGPNLSGLQGGWMNPTPARRMVVDREAIGVLDGDGGIGILGCHHAMADAIDRARRFGIGMVSVTRSNHFLSAAPYCLRAAEQGMIGLVTSNTQASMGYPNARGRVIGNGPMGFGVPSNLGFPIIYDAALTTSAGQLERWVREGMKIPSPLLGLDPDGRLTDDPAAVLAGGTPLPIGGHKGAGLAILVEILTGVLAGGAFLDQILRPGVRDGFAHGETQTCVAIDIARFMEHATFADRVRQLADTLRRRAATGGEPVVLPGERAARHWARSAREGVVVPRDVAHELAQWAHRLKLDLHDPVDSKE